MCHFSHLPLNRYTLHKFLSGTRDAENDRLRWAERHLYERLCQRLLKYSPLFHLFHQTHPRLRER
ncbi:hypothetical protein [Nostoc sp. DSM 114167]|uniref:hypothetical protein n=1 Tax=Nostoc sp. DSM 114167 TaxID=3439050 RepID=UPI004045A371